MEDWADLTVEHLRLCLYPAPLPTLHIQPAEAEAAWQGLHAQSFELSFSGVA